MGFSQHRRCGIIVEPTPKKLNPSPAFGILSHPMGEEQSPVGAAYSEVGSSRCDDRTAQRAVPTPASFTLSFLQIGPSYGLCHQHFRLCFAVAADVSPLHLNTVRKIMSRFTSAATFYFRPNGRTGNQPDTTCLVPWLTWNVVELVWNAFELTRQAAFQTWNVVELT